MFSDVNEISVLMNIIHGHPWQDVPITPGMYRRYFENNVPISKKIFDRHGEVSIIMVDKTQAIDFFKDRYNFMESGDVEKELKDARSNL